MFCIDFRIDVFVRIVSCWIAYIVVCFVLMLERMFRSVIVSPDFRIFKLKLIVCIDYSH